VLVRREEPVKDRDREPCTIKLGQVIRALDTAKRRDFLAALPAIGVETA
jgi:hypothetical protein